MKPFFLNTKPFAKATLLRALLPCVTIPLLSLAGSATGFASEVVFSDDFENHTAGEAPGEPWTEVGDGPNSGSILVLQDEDDLFGKGTDNRILEYRKDQTHDDLPSAQNLVTEESFSAEVASIRFSFYQPEDEFDEHSWIILYAGSRSTGNRAQVIDFGAEGDTIGTSATYERGTVNELELIVNNGAGPIVYGDGQILDGGETDIWINGELAEEAFSAHNNQRGPISTFEFNTSGSRKQVFYLDEIVIESLDVEAFRLGLEDDFEGHTVGEAPGEPWTQVVDGPFSGSVLVLQDEDDLFGKGPENQILEYRKDGTDPDEPSNQALIAEEAFSAEVASIRFSFYQPDDEFNDHSWIILHAGSRSTGNRAQVINFGADGDTIGTSATYERGVVNDVELIVNNTTSPIEYGEDDQVLFPGSTDIWINGELEEEGFSSQNNRLGAITSFEFNTSGGRRQVFFADDFIIEPIPAEDVQIQIALEDDFEGHTVGAEPGEPWNDVRTGPGAGSILVLRDDDDLFGKGTDNQILEYRKDMDGISQRLLTEETFFAEVASIRFNFFQPDDEFDEHAWLMLYAGPRSTGNRAQVLNFGEDGNKIAEFGGDASVTYERGVLNELELVVNNGHEPFTYANGRTVQPGTLDIWVNGELEGEGFSASNNRRGGITGFEFNTSSSRTQVFYLDDFVVEPLAEVAPEATFAAWRDEHFTDDELGDEEISGPLADFSGDGVANLVKYALGLNPRVASLEGLPATAIQSLEVDDETDAFLTLTFDRPVDRVDLTYEVTAAAELPEWTVQAVQVSVTENGNGTVTELWRDSQPIDQANRRFMRLEVTLD